MLNQSGYSNILARYQTDLQSYGLILDTIEASNNSISREVLGQVRAVEQLFYEDETDVMRIDAITAEQADLTSAVIDSMDNAYNRTEAILTDLQRNIDGIDNNIHTMCPMCMY